MAENIACKSKNCTCTVTNFCICRSEKIYLCKDCIIRHISEPGVHIIAPIEARDQNLAAYSSRLKTVETVFASFDRVLEELEQQKGQLEDAVEQERIQTVKEVNRIFEALAGEIATKYASVKSKIESRKAELKATKAEFPTETTAWISAAVHIDEIVPFFRDVKSIVAQRMSVVFKEESSEAQHPVVLFAEAKSVSSCTCEACISTFEQLQMRPRKAIPEIQGGLVLQIQSVIRNADGKLIATVVNRGTDETWGYLCVAQQGERKAYSPQPLSFVGKSEIDISSWAQLPPGQYEASVFNSVTNVWASSYITFTVAEEQINQPQPPKSEDADFEQCFVALNFTNMKEVQQYVRTNFEETGLRTFKKIACQWKNPSHDQLDIFLQTIAGTNLQDEAAARQQLEASGFQL